MSVSTPLQAPTRAPKSIEDPPGAALARFFELRGRRIVKACGALWYSAPGRFLMSLPYQTMMDPDPAELHSMIREARAAGARFPSLRWDGLESGMYVIRRRKYEFGSVHVKHRPRVRRGQQCFQIRLAEKSELLEQGRALNLSTMARQGRYDREFGDPRLWRRLVEAAFASPGISFPAAFAGSRLAAFMVTCRDGDWLHILHQMSRQEDLANFPNHVLTYAVTAQALADEALQAVCYGYVPLFAADGLHEYKLRFGYELIPHRSAIQLDPLLNRVLEGAVTRAALRMARRFRRDDQTLETLQTVLEGARRSRRP